MANRIDRFLMFLDRHQHGILMTVLVHLVVITVMLTVRIRQSQARDNLIVMEMVEEDVQDRQELEENLTEEQRQLMQDYEEALANLRNLPVNRSAEEQAADEIEKMVQDIKEQLNIDDNNYLRPEEPDPEEVGEIVEQQKPEAPKTKREEKPNTVYQGPTTVSYDLEGRSHVKMTVPVYMCKGSGEVRLSVTVDRNGRVVDTALLSARGSDNSDCFADAALTAARSSRFNSSASAPDRQKGTIIYLFLPQ